MPYPYQTRVQNRHAIDTPKTVSDKSSGMYNKIKEKKKRVITMSDLRIGYIFVMSNLLVGCVLKTEVQ